MARTASITQDTILQVAFELLQSEGGKAVSARKLATRANCSTQPIFRVFKNMDELSANLFSMALNHFESFYLAYPQKSSLPFVNLGMAYIRFAMENKHLFALLFVADERHGKTLYDILSGKEGNVAKELTKAKADGCADPAGMFSKMWMVIHGAACMSMTGDFDLNETETRKLLEESYQAFS